MLPDQTGWGEVFTERNPKVQALPGWQEIDRSCHSKQSLMDPAVTGTKQPSLLQFAFAQRGDAEIPEARSSWRGRAQEGPMISTHSPPNPFACR